MSAVRGLLVGAALIVLTGCGDPLRDVPRLADVELSDAPRSAALPEPGESADAEPILPELTEAAQAGQDQPRRGLFSVLFPQRDPAAPPAAADAPEAEAAAAPPPEEPARPGFLAAFRPAAAAPAQPETAPGTALPFGEIARVCARPQSYGTEIDRAAGFRVYDSNPAATGPRVHYITGFGDRCARMFTASLVTLGTPSSHEFFRYTAQANRPYSETDEAYEAIKSRLCNARRGAPCGARMDQVERSTIFVSVYATFGGGTAPATLLLHDGDLAATTLP